MRTVIGLAKVSSLAILTISATFFVFLCAVVFLIARSFMGTSTNNLFCEPDDPIYQMIVDNSAEWIDTVTADNFTGNVYPRFSSDETNRGYNVVSEFRQNSGDFIGFYVSTLPGFPNRPQGARGYIYSVEGQALGEFWTEDYTVIPFGENVFCYSPK